MAGIDDFLGADSAVSDAKKPTGGISSFLGEDKPKSSLARRLIGDTAVSAVKGAIGLTEVPVGIADMATGGMAGKALEGIGYRPKEAKAMLDEMYSPEQKAANKAVSDAEGFFGTAKAALQNPSTIGQSVIESAPLLLPGAAIARGVGAAGKIAPVVAGGIGEGVVGAGLAAEQMRQNSEDGTLSARQTGAALASGAGTAAFGIAGGKLAQSAIGKKLGLADVDTALAMSPAQRASAGGIDAGIAKRIAGGAVSEGALEELPQSMWEQAAQNYGEGKPIGEGVAEAGAMGALAGGVMGSGFNALQGRLRGTVEKQPPAPAQEAPRAPPAPTYTGTPNDQTMAAEVERANQVAAAQANADAIYAERAAFEQERAPAKLPVTGPLSAAVNVGIDSGATSITSPANPRYEIPAQPRGSFAQLDELASLIGQERADVADRRELAQLVGQERRDQERRIAEAADSRRALDAALADTDRRAAGVAAQESEAARLRLLDNILSSVSDTGNPARQFGNALRRAGYRNTDFTERERQVIQRFSDARAALRSPEATTVPAAPNELDAASLGIRERSTDGAMQGDSGRDNTISNITSFAQQWDRENRGGRSIEWQSGAALANPSFNAVELEGEAIPAHGMAKSATLGDAVKSLISILNGGIDQSRTLFYAPLTASNSMASGGGTAGGYAYRDGPFIITFRRGMTGQPTADDISGVLVNSAHPELVAPLQAMFPNLIVRDYYGVADLVEASRQKTGATQAASGRDKIGEAVSLLSQGWKLALNKTLVSPTGKKRKLNAEEFAAVREARAKMINKTEAGNAATKVDAVSDQGRGDVAAGGIGNAQPVRSIARGRSGNAGTPLPSMRAAGGQVAIKNAEAAPAVTRTKDTLSDTVYSKSEADRVLSSGGGVRVRLNDGSSITFINLQDDEGYGDVHAYSNDGKRIGLLGYFTTTDYKGGPIEPSVHVEEQYRRKGIASAMYDIAEQTGGIIPDTSSRNAWRSEDGQAFRLGRDAKNKKSAATPTAKQSSPVAGNQNPIKKPAPIMRRDDLVGAIMRVTGGNGIAANMAQTIIGDKANQATKVRGLFQNAGTMDLDDTADLLRTQEGYDVRDGNHLAELIREQAAGNPVVSMERAEREAAENAEKEYRNEINRQAESLGLKKIGGKRTLQVVEADIAREEKRLSDLEADAERRAIQDADAIESAIDAGMTEADFMRWLSDDIAGTYTEEEIQRAEQDRTDRENARAEARSIADAEGRAQGAAGQGNGNRPSTPEGRGTEGGTRGATARGEVGSSLSSAERKAVLKTLVDVYKQNRAPKEFKGLDSNGNERYGYAHSPEYFMRSDITGAMVRYYVTLPDGRIAHPTELFADYTQSDIDAEIQRQASEEKASEEGKKWRNQQIDSIANQSLQKVRAFRGEQFRKVGKAMPDRLVEFYSENEGKWFAVEDQEVAKSFVNELRERGYREVATYRNEAGDNQPPAWMPKSYVETGFDLARQTNAEAAAEFKRQQEEAAKKDDAPASPAVFADQGDLLNTQGALFNSNRDFAPADVSKIPQKTNTSGEPVQKTAENEQVEPADKLDPAKIRANRTAAEEPPSDSTGQNFESRSASPADAEFSATERAYGGREAFDRAKAAGKTKLNYRQWVQVRTPKFKEWFGDWEAAKENESFNAILKQVENGAIKSGTIIQLGTAGSILNQFGIPSLKIEMTQSVLSQHMKKHGIGFDHLRDLAAHVQAPIAVFKSKRSADSVILLTEIQHPDGDLVVALQANKERNRLVINDIRSIHPKPSQKIDFWIDDGLLIGVDESRGRHLLSTTDRSNSGRGERQEASDVILFNTEALRNVSKVVDPETGEPMVVYHGTTADINEFRPAGGRAGEWQKALDHFKKAQSNNDRYGYMNFRDGSFFSPKPEYAGNYTGENSGVMYQAFILAKNPVYFDMSRKHAASGVDPNKTPDALMLYSGDKSNLNEIAVIDPLQIKSATGNNGNFDGGNPDIRESRSRSPSARFFSQLSRAFEQAPDKVFGKAGQVKLWLASNKAKLGIKDDEIQWTGINDWLGAMAGQKVAKSDVLNYLQQNGVQVEEVKKGAEASGKRITLAKANDLLAEKRNGYSIEKHEGRYYLFDETGYEVEETFTISDALAAAGVDPAGDTFSPTKYHSYTLPGGENYRELLLMLPERTVDVGGGTRVSIGGDYKSSHWTEPNILAHVRFNDRTDADGARVLFIEELQSDWGQDGKKKGFAGTLDGAKKFYGITDADWSAMSQEDRQSYADEMAGRTAGVKGGVPSAPFVTKTEGWLDLGIKRMIAYAVENGYDKIAFVNGEQSADRYDLSKQVDSVRVAVKPDIGRYMVFVTQKGDRSPERMTEREGIEADKLPDMIGKELAERAVNDIKAGKTAEYAGLDLKIGGEGMKTFYDQIVPQRIRKVTEKIGGGKLEAVRIGETDQVGFSITDAMREKVMGGLPLFSKSAAAAKPLNARQKLALNVVQKTADKFRAEYAGAAALDIRVVYSRDDIPEFFRPSPYAEGVYHDSEGIIYLVASNLPTRQRAWQVLMHEAIGHYGLANMMGDQFSSLWETVLKRAVSSQPLNRNPQPGEANYETVDAVRRLYPEASDAEVAQEVLARMAETMPNVGWFRMAMARIRVWLKNAAKAFGLKLEPTMADVRRLVELAGYHVRSGANLGQDAGARDVAFASQATGRQSNIASMPNDTTASGQQNAPAPEADIGEAKYGGIEYTPAPKDRISANRLRKINARGLAHAQTGDWESYYTPIFHIAYQLGQNGVDISGAPIVEGIRYGASPEFGVSKNYTDDIAESGLSLAMLRGEREISSSIWFKDRKAHEYRGLLVGNGSDGEPTILPLHVENLDDASAAESINNEPSASAGSGVMESRSATIGRNESIIDQMRNAGRRMAGSAWSVSEPSKIDDLIYSLQDKQVDLKRVIQSIAATGKKIGDDINAYLQEELFHGRSAKGVKDFLDFELRPLLREMQMLGIDMGDFEEYLWNRHAEERNNQIAKINPDMPDGGSGINTADARAYLAELSADQKRKMEALAARIDQMNRNSQRILVESGLEKQETIDAWNGAYQHYVPLQREDVDTGHTGTGKGFSIRGSSSKRAMGSGKKVVDIIANLTQQRERNIVRAEKNRVSNALFGLAVQNPNPDFWKVDEAPKERVVKETVIYTVLDADGNKIDEFTRMAEAERLANKTPGATIDQSWADRVTERIVPGFKNRDNVILTRIDGEDHYVILNERDDRAMRLSAAMKNLDMDNMGRALSIVGKATRYLASVNTQYNPVFGVINLVRDVQGALLNLQSTQLAGEQKRVAGYTVDALRGIYADIRAHRRGEKPSSKWAELFEEFQKEGGQTGYRDQYANAEARAEDIVSELNQFKEGKFKMAARAVFGWLSDYNETMENAVRLAAYKTAKEKGLSNQQAASIAKNLTVNFNRKGQMTTQIGALYAFFNASVQGTARMAETLFEKNDGDAKKIRLSKLGKRIISGGIMLGSMQAMLLAAAGFDDDEPPEFVRERNLILPTGDGKYLTLAMPLGFHVIPGIGRIATEFALSGFKDPAKRIVSMFGMFAETFNPVGSSGFSIQTLTPSIVDPFAALAENRDFTGREIYRENFNANDPAPGHTRAKDVATPWSRYLSESINFITGGTDFKPGAFSPSPDAIDYLIAQATGGVGREINKAAQTVGAAYTGDDLPLYKIPLVGRFVGDTEGQSGTSQKFYGAIREINAHEREVNGLRESGRVIEAQEYIADNPVYRMRLFANLVENQVRKLRDARRKASDDGDSDRVRAINDQITRMMTGFNERALPLLNQ